MQQHAWTTNRGALRRSDTTTAANPSRTAGRRPGTRPSTPPERARSQRSRSCSWWPPGRSRCALGSQAAGPAPVGRTRRRDRRAAGIETHASVGANQVDGTKSRTSGGCAGRLAVTAGGGSAGFVSTPTKATDFGVGGPGMAGQQPAVADQDRRARHRRDDPRPSRCSRSYRSGRRASPGRTCRRGGRRPRGPPNRATSTSG